MDVSRGRRFAMHAAGPHVLLVWVCCRRWRQSLYRQAPKKQANHTAMSDIKESLKELQYYKHVLFRGK